MRSRWVLFVPLVIMGLLFGAFIYRLTVPNDTLIQSQWINKPMPLFDLPPATAGLAIGDEPVPFGQPFAIRETLQQVAIGRAGFGKVFDHAAINSAAAALSARSPSHTVSR